MDDKKREDRGCGCACDFKKEVDELVKEGQKPTPEEHMDRKEEIEKAFNAADKPHK